MRKKTIYILFVIMIGFLTAGLAQAQTEKELFDRARLALFDRKWDDALNDFNRLSEKYSNSVYNSQVYFYKGKCWEEKKVPSKAIENYKAFLKISDNESLNEEASRAIIDLYYTRYEAESNTKYLDEIARFLDNNQIVAQYYAAFKLSHIKNKEIASKAVPVLKKIIADESDDDLVDRAKIALMRINPELLKKSSQSGNTENRVLCIRIYDKKSKKDSMSINIPFALARLAMESIPQNEKSEIKKKGFDTDRILDMIVKTGEIFRLDVEDTIIKIWVK